jgi:hypothetical protein
MFDRLVADGDNTSTGGVVFGYSDFLNEEGNAYARKENKATCGNCKGAWPIYGTASDWMDGCVPYVKDADRVLCLCGKNIVFAAGSSNAFYSGSDGEPSVAALPPTALIYDQQYTLKSSEGQPFANVPYRVRFGSEVVASGVTDSQGMTQRIAMDAAKRLTLEITGDH